MGELSYPYAGGGGVTDARYERLMADVVGSGRLAYRPTSTTLSQSLVYADSTGRQVKVRASQAALVRGFKWESDASGLIQPIDANTSGQTRIDLAVLRLDRATFTVGFRIVKGSPAASPVAPAATQTIASDGVWELPIATIRVTSSSTSGLPSIALTDVTPLDYFLAPPAVVGHSTRKPPADYGAIWHQYDTNRSYIGWGGTAFNLFSEDDPLVRVTAIAAGWTDPANFYVTRRNGFVWMQGTAVLTRSDASAGTSLLVCALPGGYRPRYDVNALGYFNGGNPCRLFINSSTGQVTVTEYAATFKTGFTLTMHPMTFPAE